MQHRIHSIGQPPGLGIDFSISQTDLKRIIRDSLWNSVVASCEIEDIDVSDMPRPSADTIPNSMLSIS